MHAYEVVNGVGEARYFVANKSKGGMRPTTIRDVRAMGWLPSPTEVIKTLAKPSLLNWLIRQAVHAVVTSPDIEGENLDAKIERILDTEKQQDAESQAAMDLGTRIHEAIEKALSDVFYPVQTDLIHYAVNYPTLTVHFRHCSSKYLATAIDTNKPPATKTGNVK